MCGSRRPGRAVALLAGFMAAFAPARRAMAYRPFVSTDAAVADVGDVEVEFGYAGFREDHGRVTIVAPTLIGNLGVARDVEVVGEFKLANDLSRRPPERATRFEDSAVSVKWVLHEGVLQEVGTRPSFAVELSALLPTLHGEDHVGGELAGLMSGALGGWTYHLNAGPLVEPGSSEPGVAWGVIGEHAVGGGLRAVAEVNGESIRGSRADDSALLGAIWTVPAPAPLHELSFDVGVRRGISSASDSWGGTAGLTFAFPCWRPSHEGSAP